MNRKLKNLILTVFLCLAAVPAFAVEEYVSLVYKEIDVAFADRSDENLNNILQKYQGDNYYFLMENYSMKKVRRLIIINDYEFAMDADLVIIDNNLDNIEAVELYATITDAYEMQKAVQRVEEEKRKAEEVRLVTLKEEQRGTAAKQYNAITTSTGNTVYVTGKDGGQLTYNSFNYAIGITPSLITNTSSVEENNLKQIAFGVGFDFGYSRMVNNLNVGGDFSLSARPMSFALSGKDESFYFDGNLNFKIAFRNFMDKFFIRAGVDAEGALQGQNNPEKYNQELQKTLISPTVGIKLQEIPLGNMFLTTSFDWLAASFWTKGLDAAAKFDMTMNVPFGATEKVNLDFVMGVKDSMFMKETGFENRMNFILALGGRNVK